MLKKGKSAILCLGFLIFLSGFWSNPQTAKADVISKSGHITSDETWTTGNVYVIQGYITVDVDVTLTIQEGVIVKFVDNKLLDVNGALKVQGTASNPVYFTSYKDDTVGGDTNNDGSNSQPAAGDWGQINFANTSDDAESIIEHAEFRYGGYHQDTSYACCSCSYSEDWYYSDPGGCGRKIYRGTIRLVGASPTIRNNLIRDGSGYALSIDVHSEPTTSGNVLTGNAGNGMEVREGKVTTTEPVTRTWDNTDVVYVVSGYLTYGPDVTLVVGPGVKVKVLPNKLIDIQGALKVQGTAADPTYFTSYKDDTVGGDTNNDGSNSQPAAGDWGQVNLANTSDDAESIIEHAEFRYGGYHQDTSYACCSCSYSEDWYYSDPGGCGRKIYRGTIRLVGASPTIRNNLIRDGSGYALSIDVHSEPTTSGNVLTGNAGNGMEVRKGKVTTTEPVTRTWDNTDVVYVVSGFLTYGPDVTLVVGPGVKVKVLPNKLIDIQGALKVQGVASDPVYFTSYKDDTVGGDTNNDGSNSQPAAGDWGQVNFADTSNDAESIIEHAEFRYGGYHQDTSYACCSCSYSEDWYYSDPGGCGRKIYRGTIRLVEASPTIRNNLIRDGSGYALSIDVHSEPTTSGNALTGNAGNGMEVREGKVTTTEPVTRTWDNTDVVYVVSGYLTYGPDVTLVVSPGIKVKVLPNKLIDIQGALKVQGTAADPIYFTSYKDDTVGGDTNNDGSNSQPAAGDWGHVNLADTSDNVENIIEHAEFRYGGYHQETSYACCSCSYSEDWYYSDPGGCSRKIYRGIVRSNGAYLTLRHSRLEYSSTDGLYIYHENDDPDVTVQYCTFRLNDGSGVNVVGP